MYKYPLVAPVSRNSRIVKSDLYEAWGKSKKIPARLNYFKKDDEWIDPLMVEFQKRKERLPDIDDAVVDACVDHAFATILQRS